MRRLLLISCSATKREGAGVMPALTRYDGPKFRVLRKALAEGIDPPTIRILSALYGIIPPDYPITEYDVELTDKNRALSRGDINIVVSDADDVFVMAGGYYTAILRLWCPAASSSWRYASGAPGQRLQQLGQWLREGGAS